MENHAEISNTQDAHIATRTKLRKGRKGGNSKIYSPRPFV